MRFQTLLGLALLSACGGTSSIDGGTGGGSAATGGGSAATGGGSAATGGGSAATGGGSAAKGGGSAATGGGSEATGGGSEATGGGSAATGGGSAATGGGSAATGGGSAATGGGSGSTALLPTGKYTTFNRSGSRLTAVAVLDELGNSQVAWFFDTQKNVRCTITRASDGQRRCLPVAPAPAQLMIGSGPGPYSDSNCTMPLISLQSECAAASLFMIGTQVYQRSGSPVTTGFVRRQMPNGMTVCSASTPGAGLSWINASVVPPTDFVAFSPSVIGTDPLIRLSVLEGSDGSSVIAALVDQNRNSLAALRTAPTGGTTHLVAAVDTANAMGLARAMCGSGADVYVGPEQTSRPAFLEVLTRNGGGQPVEVYRPIVGVQNTFCPIGSSALQTVTPGLIAYVLGDQTQTLPLSAFPQVTVAPDTRPGQRFSHLYSDGGVPLAPSPVGSLFPLIDGGTVGNTLYFFDGGLHGFTGQQLIPVQLYRDAACTQPAVESALPAGTVVTEQPQCPLERQPGLELVGVYQSTGTASLSNVYQWQAGVCTAVGQVSTRATTPLTGTALQAAFPPLRLGAP